MKDIRNTSYETLLALSKIPWRGAAIGLLDLDAFFASVEQLDNPQWRGKPVVVGGKPDSRGVVATASYEAREYGIHSAMSSKSAWLLCPHAIFTPGRMSRYEQVSAEVMDIIKQETPYVEQVSIDEAFFDISPGRFSRESPIEICQRIQSRVDSLGISASIGLGTNKSVAKIASDMEKPHGITVVMPGSEKEFLSPLACKKMSGIGKSMDGRLRTLGIKTLGALAACDDEILLREFGVVGPRMKIRAKGEEVSQVSLAAEADEVKSVSNERTFSTDLTSRRDIEAAIKNISSMVARRLRKQDLKGNTVSLKLRFDFTHTKTQQVKLPRSTNETQPITHAALSLLDKMWKQSDKVRLIGIGVSGFGEQDQLSFDLFDDTSLADNKELTQASDKIKERFGDSALSYGRELRFKKRGSGFKDM